jgi:dipeptidase
MPDVVSKQKEIEQGEFAMQAKIEERAMALNQEDPDQAIQLLTRYCNDNAYEVMNKWWDFAHLLMAKYNLGFNNYPKASVKMGYPEKWRDQVGYKNGPTSYKKK